MNNLLFWLYIIELTLLILHKIGSTYWKEWDLFQVDDCLVLND